MVRVTLRFHAELNDLLPPERRHCDWTRLFQAPAPARHLIEACGVPHTEVGRVRCNGALIDLETPIDDGAHLLVDPQRACARALETRPPRFLADAHLGALARDLRLLGFDTLWSNDWGDAELARRAALEQRILLSRDRALLMRREVVEGIHVAQGPCTEQLARLVWRLRLCDRIAPFTRCLICNTPLSLLEPRCARARLPVGFRCTSETFWTCAECARIYWRGSHWRAMCQRVETLCPEWRGHCVLDLTSIP